MFQLGQRCQGAVGAVVLSRVATLLLLPLRSSQVRVLVATAIREAIPTAAWFPAGVECGAAAGHLNERALLEVLATGDRLRSAPAAPAVGLCFLEAGYCDWLPGTPQR